MVVWESLDRIPNTIDDFRSTIELLRNRLRFHIGLYFHRLLAGTRDRAPVRVYLEVQEFGARETDIATEIKPLDPFGYSRSGAQEFPRRFALQIAGLPQLSMETHLWPARVETPEYLLDDPKRRQGFYLYRNDRLILGGGWLGVTTAKTPNLQLARIAIDLPAEVDHDFHLDIRKVNMEPPPGFGRAVRDALDVSTENRLTFAHYLNEAKRLGSQTERGSKLRDPLVSPVHA